MRDFFTMWRDEFPIVMIYMYIIHGMYMTRFMIKGLTNCVRPFIILVIARHAYKHSLLFLRLVV